MIVGRDCGDKTAPGTMPLPNRSWKPGSAAARLELLLLGLAALCWSFALAGDPERGFFSCHNMVHNTSDHAPLFNCTQLDGGKVFECEVVLMTTGKDFLTNLNLELVVRLRRAPDEARCLLLEAVNASFVPAGRSTVPFGDVEDSVVYTHVERLRVALALPRPVPFGRTCELPGAGAGVSPYRPSACLDSNTVLVTSVIRLATAERRGVLERLRYLHDVTLMLEAELLELTVKVFQLNDLQLQTLLDLLEGTRVREVVMCGGSWGSVPLDLGRQPRLTDLDLSNSKITNISTTDFGAVPELQSLVLRENAVRHIPEGFRQLTKLQRLDLSKNPLQTTASVSVLGSLTALRELRLSECGLRTLDEALPLPARLSLLDLSNNALSALAPLLPAALTHLDLSRNHLGPGLQLRQAAGAAASTLQLADLSYNRLEQIVILMRDGQVVSEPWTQWLNLSGNLLRTLSATRASSLRHSAAVGVLLQRNEWDCLLCDTAPLRDWILQPPAGGPVVHDEVLCEKPAELPVRKAKSLDGCTAVDKVLAIALPLAALGLLCGLVGALAYSYRFELTYLRHILGVKIGAARRGRSETATGVVDDDTTRYKYDAFVSYSASDREWVLDRLLPGLERAPERFRLCLHERDFAPGTFITINIVSSMQASRRMIVVLSDAFVSSQWCQWELDMAKHQVWEEGSDFLLLLELERLERRGLPRHLRALMETRTYLEWPAAPAGDHEEAAAWARLREALSPSLQQLRHRARQLQQLQHRLSREQLQLHPRRARRGSSTGSPPADDACSDVTDVTSA